MTAPHDDGRGYRDVIAEMRDGLVARVGHFFRWRGPVLRDDKPRYAKLIRADIRRIRAIDFMCAIYDASALAGPAAAQGREP